MLRNLGICALAGLALTGIARADVYRWLDEHGEPHYSDRWVPGSQLIRSSRPHPTAFDGPDSRPGASAAPSGASSGASAEATSSAGQAGSGAPPTVDAESLKAVKADTAKRREQQCKEARDRYDKAMTARRIFKPGAKSDDERQYLSEDEADAYRARALKDVKELCGGVPPSTG